jgi:hypothetical protein
VHTEEIATMSANDHRRFVPARVVETLELRQGSRTDRHADRRREDSRQGCRNGKALRRALAEQAWR